MGGILPQHRQALHTGVRAVRIRTIDAIPPVLIRVHSGCGTLSPAISIPERYFMRLIVLMFAASLMLINRPAAGLQDSPGWCVSAWYPSSGHRGGYTSLMSHLETIDIVNPFWYSPNRDGSLLRSRAAEDAGQLAAWREAGLRIIPSLHSGRADVIEDEARRAAHIAAIVALADRMAYDGIDIDYEGFSLSAREPFSQFIEELSQALHAEGRLLSVTVHAKSSDSGFWEGAASQDWVRLAPAADIFNIMTYDYTGRAQPPGPIAPTDWVLDVLAYAETILDLQRVRLGIPFYGYTWLRGEPPAETIQWETIMQLVNAFIGEIQRLPGDQEAFVALEAPGLPPRIIHFADAEGLRYKLERVLEAFPRLGGLAIWGLGGEDPASWDVLADLRPASCAR
jgi:hypothetical protein